MPKLFSAVSGFPCFGKPWHFELYVWSIRVQCWPDSESGRETILASDSSSEFPRSKASLMVSWLVKNRLTLVQLKTLNSFMSFSQVQNCYPEAFYKCSNNLFAWSKILENGLYSGGVRRKRSMAALMDLAIRAIFLPRRRVKKLQTNIQFFL